ncbi:RNA polymerase sigma factor [Paractinoplanes rishiriensis]|uniref:DNA-directed RNA polymerase sigma-70 factor n=1 Tax=Paractinoplanes rishiriensis TaxID=1050105 RepID=A0A919MRU0_9ACTN|nr:RNA polymerase sigma factor [Actinoplanes rishiriensis]GIE97566.1 DNA-directed RNA polymerase sigma-70 factor [Actinoplanes rishiriensis]
MRHEQFTVMFRVHYPLVLAFVSRRTDAARAHDVVADTFTTAWRHFDRLPAEPLPWLYRVARNCLANELRADRRQARVAEKIAGHGLEPEPDHALSVIADTGLRQALQRLSPADREALLLIGWEGLDHDAAATVLGCSAVTFKVRVHRARRRLTRLLAAADRDEKPAPAVLPSPAPAHRKARSA